MAFTFGPRLIMGLLHAGSLRGRAPESCREIVVLGIWVSGSVNMAAVASTVRGNRNPEFGSAVENTDSTTAPWIPEVSRAASARTIGTCNNFDGL